jgi:hypothetical protein
VFDIRPAVAWVSDIQKAITVAAAKHFRGQNPPRGSAISYWLKSEPSGDVRISISDVTGREVRSLPGTKTAGLNRVQWDLATPSGGRGRGQGSAQGATAPAAIAEPALTGQQPSTAGRGQQPAQPAQPAQTGRGGGRGGSAGPPVAPGTYLVKITAGDKLIGQKTIVVEPDLTFMQ